TCAARADTGAGRGVRLGQIDARARHRRAAATFGWPHHLRWQTAVASAEASLQGFTPAHPTRLSDGRYTDEPAADGRADYRPPADLLFRHAGSGENGAGARAARCRGNGRGLLRPLSG